MFASLRIILGAYTGGDLLNFFTGLQKFLDILIQLPAKICRCGIGLFLFTHNSCTQPESKVGRAIVTSFRRKGLVTYNNVRAPCCYRHFKSPSDRDMKPETDEYHIDSIEDLLALYGEPIP